MNRQKSKGSRLKSYRRQDLIKACKQVRTEKLTCAEAAIKYGVPRSTIWYAVKYNCRTIRENQVEKEEENKRAEPRKDTRCVMDKVKRKKDLCCFCGIGDDHELELGKMYNLENISVHYYCLLFSSGLPQNGDDDEGIMGFLAKDIEKEVQRGRKLSCSYCLKKGATIGCSEKKCRRTYHYHCGLKHYAVCRFSNDFRSYCVQHRKFQKGSGIGEELKCPICMEELIVDPKTAVWAPCCKRKSWFHKICLQRLALSAGYFFKCPLCNNQDKFLLEMQNVGIFVPEKDASWELEPNAFRELHERPLHCDASKCKCPDGRKTDVEGSRWEILLCNLCGSSGVHIACGGLSFSSTEWTCTVCAEMLAKSGKCMQQKVQERHLKEKNVKIEQNLLESECTSSITTVCKSSSHDKICVIKSDCSSEDTIIDVGDWNHTPCKRKLEVMGRSKETLAKVCHFDGVGTESIINVDDSDEEIDIKSGENQVPPYTVIRKLEEHGTDLPKELEMIKKHALRAQERMLELCLTESEIVKMAKESSQFKGFSLNESDIISFYKYNLPLEKMLQVQKLVTTIFALQKNVSEVQPSSIRKQNKVKAVIPRIRKSRRKSVIGTQNVSVPPTEISVTQSSISVERIPSDIEESVQKENSSLRDSWSISNENPVDMKFSSTVECEDEQQEMNEDIKVEGKYVSKSLNAFNESVSPLYINSVRDSPPAAQPFEKQSGVSNAHHTSLPLIFVSPLSNKFLSLMAQESSTSDEIMENQAARDKENTIRNQKDNEGMNQEACTSGACRKLLLEPESCAEMSDECDNPTPLEFSDRYGSALKPLVTNTVRSELPEDVEKKSESKNVLKLVVNRENIVTDTLEFKVDSEDKSSIIKGNEKPLQLLIQPFGLRMKSSSMAAKKKQRKSRSHDKNRYIQKTLSPFLVKQNNLA